MLGGSWLQLEGSSFEQNHKVRIGLVSVAAGLFLAPSFALAREDGPSPDSFTVAVIPDTQNYADFTHPQPASLQPFKQQTQYLASYRRALHVAFVPHLGDVVHTGTAPMASPVTPRTAQGPSGRVHSRPYGSWLTSASRSG